jgi:DNA-binding response OmpR family regulator
MSSRAAVLLVEDDASIRTTLSAALTIVGFSVYQAGTIDAALTLLGTEQVNAIVLDAQVPDPSGLRRTGLHLLTFVRASAELSRLPVVIFTGRLLSEAEEHIAQLHNARVFYKPHGSTELIDHLTTVLTSPSD